MEPQIIVGGNEGFHNVSPDTQRRLKQGKQYKDLSTVCVIPTRGMIPARVVESWWGLTTPMNNAFVRLMVKGMEVGDAYNTAVEMILAHPQLKKFKYLLTLEEDNLPPPDGLLKLYENMGAYDAVGGLYWTKGEGGQPMIYGHPKGVMNFRPQVPVPESIQECNGLGMGFTLFRLSLFTELEKPWFVTTPVNTQDLYCFERMRKAGMRVACDTRVKVGHYDKEAEIVW